jgi:hypothetical protein
MDFLSPAVVFLKRGFRENQSQKFALSGSDSFSAWLSAQPEGPKWRQLLHDRRSFPQSGHLRDLPRGSGSVTGEPQYQHMSYHTIKSLTTQYGKNPVYLTYVYL